MSADVGGRAVPYACPFCAEDDLRPQPEGRWHCRSCLRVFSISFHGVRPSGADADDLAAIASGSAAPGPTVPGATSSGKDSP